MSSRTDNKVVKDIDSRQKWHFGVSAVCLTLIFAMVAAILGIVSNWEANGIEVEDASTICSISSASSSSSLLDLVEYGQGGALTAFASIQEGTLDSRSTWCRNRCPFGISNCFPDPCYTNFGCCMLSAELFRPLGECNDNVTATAAPSVCVGVRASGNPV